MAETAEALFQELTGSAVEGAAEKAKADRLSKPLLDELPTADLDLHLELDVDLTVFVPANALQLGGLQPGEPFAVDVHPLSLGLNPVSATGDLSGARLPLARVDGDGRIHLPFEPPRLSGRRVLLQFRRRGPFREIHLLADPR